MLGAIIGDIVGSHYEFNNTKDYNFELFAEPSSYTDDTVMTVAVARALMYISPVHQVMLLVVTDMPLFSGSSSTYTQEIERVPIRLSST